MSEDKEGKLDSFLDSVDNVVGKIVGGLSKVHTPDKEYPTESRTADQASPAVATSDPLLLGPVKDAGGTRFHLYRATNPSKALCPETRKPELYWRPNRSSREAILICFGCLSALLAPVASSKELSDGR